MVSVHQTVNLKLWFVRHWLREHREEAFPYVLRQRVDIFRKTDFFDTKRMKQDTPDFDVPDWLELERQAEHLYDTHKDDGDSSGFERTALAIFRPALDRRAQRDSADQPPPPEFKAGCLNGSDPLPEDRRKIALHIGNPLRPRSIFDDPDYLPRCLLQTLDQAEEAFGCSILHCGTWLNSHPRWQALFPREWMDNMTPPDPDIQWHLGFWGQFINARGTFHEKNASAFRETGEMPFPYRVSECTFNELRRHLRDSFQR